MTTDEVIRWAWLLVWGAATLLAMYRSLLQYRRLRAQNKRGSPLMQRRLALHDFRIRASDMVTGAAIAAAGAAAIWMPLPERALVVIALMFLGGIVFTLKQLGGIWAERMIESGLIAEDHR